MSVTFLAVICLPGRRLPRLDPGAARRPDRPGGRCVWGFMRSFDRPRCVLGAAVFFLILSLCASAPSSRGTLAEPLPPAHLVHRAQLSPKLRGGLHSPMPGGQMAGYYGDTGLDISGRFQPVFAIAAGTLDYAERGHTVWRGPRDTDYCVRIELDTPLQYRGKRITHLYYAHLSAVDLPQAENAPVRQHVNAGERLGISGIANGVAHLHLGLIVDGRVDQEYYVDVLREWEVRELLGGYKKNERLPASSAVSALPVPAKP